MFRVRREFYPIFRQSKRAKNSYCHRDCWQNRDIFRPATKPDSNRARNLWLQKFHRRRLMKRFWCRGFRRRQFPKKRFVSRLATNLAEPHRLWSVRVFRPKQYLLPKVPPEIDRGRLGLQKLWRKRQFPCHRATTPDNSRSRKFCEYFRPSRPLRKVRRHRGRSEKQFVRRLANRRLANRPMPNL